jgi:hypothetical protein
LKKRTNTPIPPYPEKSCGAGESGFMSGHDPRRLP